MFREILDIGRRVENRYGDPSVGGALNDVSMYGRYDRSSYYRPDRTIHFSEFCDRGPYVIREFNRFI